MYEFLPQAVQEALRNVNGKYLYEIRLRSNRPIQVNHEGRYVYLGQFGLTERADGAMECSEKDVEECVYKAGNYSVYSVEEQIRNGFVTTKEGARIGLCGEYVFEHGQPLALRNFTSLCIRIPHEIVGCAKEVYHSCMSDKVRNVLIASPPGLGKTTLLRDLARTISEKTRKNLLVCDERGEISIGNLGATCDVLKYADKTTAFSSGIRSMRPDVIITDELSDGDAAALKKAKDAGVFVVATAHLTDISEAARLYGGLFERYVFLKEDEIGKIKGVYDALGQPLV